MLARQFPINAHPSSSPECWAIYPQASPVRYRANGRSHTVPATTYGKRSVSCEGSCTLPSLAFTRTVLATMFSSSIAIAPIFFPPLLCEYPVIPLFTLDTYVRGLFHVSVVRPIARSRQYKPNYISSRYLQPFICSLCTVLHFVYLCDGTINGATVYNRTEMTSKNNLPHTKLHYNTDLND